jgi:uncharacterized HAD superfamily protein
METIIVDLDNVISDTDCKIRQLVREKYGIGSKRNNIINFNYEDCLPITKEQAGEVLNDFHKYHIKDLRLIPGAKQSLSAIKEYYKIIIATQRPILTEQDTYEWIRLKGISNEDIFFVKNKTDLLALDARWFIDDKWENAIEIAQNNRDVLLFDRPWNRKKTNKPIVRVKGWKEIVDLLLPHSC